MTKTVPEEDQILCETCGYILAGLPSDARCPECGTAVSESTRRDLRTPPFWERRPGLGTFLATSLVALLRPSVFFRHFTTRTAAPSSAWFAVIWRVVSSILLTLAILGHASWLEGKAWTLSLNPSTPLPMWLMYLYGALKVFCVVWVYLAIWVIEYIAARLTAWEAAYRGLRLPQIAVQRGLQYHSVHLLPIAVLAAVTVYGYQFLLRHHMLTSASDTAYLYVLCAEVLISAAYLFFTYWAAMRNMLYANR